jgi:ABC-2 type transport system ATP-binding protein
VAIINAGRVLACDRPAALKQRLQRDVLFTLETKMLSDGDVASITGVPGVRNVTHRTLDGRTTVELTLIEEQVLGAVFATLQMRAIGFMTLTKREATLEDVFVDLVGRSMEEVEGVPRAAGV